MTSKDLQAHYRAELARMLGSEAGRHVNRKTTAWMLKHAAATEGGTYTPETGARTWIWSDLHLHHNSSASTCACPSCGSVSVPGSGSNGHGQRCPQGGRGLPRHAPQIRLKRSRRSSR